MKRVHIVVYGMVQGVFFRANTKRVALGLDLTGYAKNLPDESVEVVAEGSEDKLKGLINFCRKGPERAEVSKVDIRFSEATGEFSGFEIKY
ncbi:MAG: acylphosphatase [Nanoarchaeota archaeon]